MAFHPATVRSVRRESKDLHAVDLEVAPEVAASYRVPGQYLAARLPSGAEAFFAPASAPGEAPLELLAKAEGDVGLALAGAAPGAPLELSEARGQGFPPGALAGRDLLLFATGAGIAPIRATLRAVLARRAAVGAIDLFFGARTREDFAYAAELDALDPRSVRVHRIVSRGTAADPHVGYVQERFARELPPVGNAVALLCGRKEMTDAVTETLLRAGLPRERVLLNV